MNAGAMEDEGGPAQIETIWSRAQFAGIVLFVFALFLLACIADHHVDEFSGPMPGIICAHAALRSVSMIETHAWVAFTGLANPLALFYVWTCHGTRASLRFRVRPYVALAALLCLGTSRIALAQARSNPLIGYYMWIASILLVLSPELSLFRRFIASWN
jgi:hypothetical protein